MYEVNTWTVNNNQQIGSGYYGYAYDGQASPRWVDVMFASEEGLLHQFIKRDISDIDRNYIYVYNPATTGTVTDSITKIKVNAEMSGGYSHTHKSFIGFSRSTGTAAVYAVDLRTGSHIQIGIVINSSAPSGTPVNSAMCCAWDGTYLHILSNNGWDVHVYNISTGAWVRKYPAPFNSQTYSMQYDRAGAMWFGSFAYSGNPVQSHFAKVAIGTGGSFTEGSILSVYTFPTFNVAPYANCSTLVAWTGQHLIGHRRATGTFHRLELSQTPQSVIISPSPARIPADGSTAQIFVKVLDATGQAIPGVNVTISIDNGLDGSSNPIPPYGSFLGATSSITDINGGAVFTYKSTANVVGTDFLKATVTY